MLSDLKKGNSSDAVVMWMLGILTAWQLIHCEESSVVVVALLGGFFFFSCRKEAYVKGIKMSHLIHKRTGWEGSYVLSVKHKFCVQVVTLSTFHFSKWGAGYPYFILLIGFLSVALCTQNTSYSFCYICLFVLWCTKVLSLEAGKVRFLVTKKRSTFFVCLVYLCQKTIE